MAKAKTLAALLRELLPGQHLAPHHRWVANKLLMTSGDAAAFVIGKSVSDPVRGSFRKDVITKAGRIFKKDGPDAAAAFLDGKWEDRPPNFQPPAKAAIVAISRSFDEWPIVKVSCAIQQYLYALPVQEFESSVPEARAQAHAAWFQDTGVDDCNFKSTQGLNAIFNHGKRTYEGVLKKAQNRNDKKNLRLERINAKRAEAGQAPLVAGPDESPTDDAGCLLHPPGINANIYCYQQVSPRPYEQSCGIQLPPEYAGYNRLSNVAIPPMPNRLDIPQGQPGYVPEHHRHGIKKFGRVRKRYGVVPGRNRDADGKRTRQVLTEAGAAAKARDSVLAVIRIGDDWTVVDLRGLLRNAQWRKLVPDGGITVQGLLDLFTGDPVIDPRRGVVTFIYKADSVGIHSEKVCRGKQSKNLLERLCAMPEKSSTRLDCARQAVALVSVDLGQRNPVAARFSRVSLAEGQLQAQLVSAQFLDDAMVAMIRSYREEYDRFESLVREQAKAALSPEQLSEIVRHEADSAESVKSCVCAKFGIDPAGLSWDKMTSGTWRIADHVQAAGGDVEWFFFKTCGKGKEIKTVRRSDFNVAKQFRLRLSPETRKDWNDAIWELKRGNPAYVSFSKRKSEFARRVVNDLVHRARRAVRCDEVVFAIEDLNISFFHGKGQRQMGWDAFFEVKQENRWFIQALHKAFVERATHKGGYVLEVAPARTSTTCPECRHCDPESRRGEQFCCIKCRHTCHADLEVATFNIEQVALTGVSLPKRLSSTLL
jgi:hypothetical protein